MRPIDADAFENFIRTYCTDSLVDLWCQLVRMQPTIDAEPVLNGRWADNNSGNFDPRDKWVKCSLCGYSTTDRFSKEYKYCPNCGAKMDPGKKRT